MPELKPISGHTGCYFIERYLEKNGRALARDFFNLSWDEREMEGYDETLKADVRWAEEMDRFREENGNHLPYGGRQARTFKHFILSPDPEDDISLDQLRELSKAWVLRFWPDYQVAIVYHDDNVGKIPHAHIVVNNTNIVTLRRMHTENPLELNKVLQDMARERGLHGMSNIMESKPGVPKQSAPEAPEADRMSEKTPRTRQQVYLGRAEKEIVAGGGYSWVSDIRNRVSIARSIAKTQGEFEDLIKAMDLTMMPNSEHARRGDWVFALADEPSKKVSGERLGYMFGKEALSRRFERIGSYRPSERSAAAIAARAENAVLLNDMQELETMAAVLNTCAKYRIRSIDEIDRKIATATSPEQAEVLRLARSYAAENKLLPTRVASSAKTSMTNERQRASRRSQAIQERPIPQQARKIERSRAR